GSSCYGCISHRLQTHLGCSNAFCCRKFRRNCKNPRCPVTLLWWMTRNRRGYGFRKETGTPSDARVRSHAPIPAACDSGVAATAVVLLPSAPLFPSLALRDADAAPTACKPIPAAGTQPVGKNATESGRTRAVAATPESHAAGIGAW